MANNLKTSVFARNVQLDALSPHANSGYLRIYDGAQPASPQEHVVNQVKLAELRMGRAAFGAAAGGIISANAISDDQDAKGSGKATWYRVFKSDGATALWDGSVGTAFADLVVNSVDIQQHARVTISSFSYTLPQ